MSIKRDSLLPSKASITALLGEPFALGIGVCSTPKNLENVSKLKGSANLLISFTNVGGVVLWLWVNGIRSTLAVSAVTAGSAYTLFLESTSLKLLATGNHSSGSTASSKGQYACMPLPEFSIVGLGTPLAIQKSLSDKRASSCDS